MLLSTKYFECRAHFNTTTRFWDGVVYNYAHPEKIMRTQFSAKTINDLKQMIDAWKKEEFEKLHEEHRVLTNNFLGHGPEMDHPVLQATGQLHTLDSKKIIVR